MAIRNYATRMSCFSLISSIESDLRSLIAKNLPDEGQDLVPEDVVRTAKDRYFEDRKENFSADGILIELLDYIDFYDLSKILNKIAANQNEFSFEEIRYITSELEKLQNAEIAYVTPDLSSQMISSAC